MSRLLISVTATSDTAGDDVDADVVDLYELARVYEADPAELCTVLEREDVDVEVVVEVLP